MQIYCRRVVCILFLSVALEAVLCGRDFWVIAGKSFSPHASVSSFWAEALGSLVAGTAEPSAVSLCPLAAGPPLTEGLMSDQNVPFGIRLLSRLGFRLGTQRDMSAGFDEAPLISPPELLRTRSAAHMAVFPLREVTFNYRNSWTAWKLTTKQNAVLEFLGRETSC